MDYVDGFLLAVPKKNKRAYTKMAKEAAEYFHKLGALKVVECWGDDVPTGKVTSFPKAVKLKEDEVVVFSWIIWPSKAVRNKAYKVMEKDKEFTEAYKDMPFDGKRMIYGGFKMIVER